MIWRWRRSFCSLPPPFCRPTSSSGNRSSAIFRQEESALRLWEVIVGCTAHFPCLQGSRWEVLLFLNSLPQILHSLKDCPGSLRLFPQAKPSSVHLACENITPARKCIFKFCAGIWQSKILFSFGKEIPFQGSCARKSRRDDVGDEVRKLIFVRIWCWFLKVFNSFYQWVALCLIGQALLFYCPRAIWLSLEGSLMKHLASSECRSKVVEKVEEKCNTLVDTFTVHLKNKYNRYFFAFLGCEILNLGMVLSQVNMEKWKKSKCLQFDQVLVTHRFIGNSFLTYGVDVFTYFSWV